MATKGALKDEVALLRSDISKLEVKIAESKTDIIRCVITAQIAIAGLILAVMKWL